MRDEKAVQKDPRTMTDAELIESAKRRREQEDLEAAAIQREHDAGRRRRHEQQIAGRERECQDRSKRLGTAAARVDQALEILRSLDPTSFEALESSAYADRSGFMFSVTVRLERFAAFCRDRQKEAADELRAIAG